MNPNQFQPPWLPIIENYIPKQLGDKYPSLKRLAGVTGFLWLIGNDRRLALTTRALHICREMALVKPVAETFKRLDPDQFGQVDLDRIRDLVFLVDELRLPGSHLTEKPLRYDRTSNVSDPDAIVMIADKQDLYTKAPEIQIASTAGRLASLEDAIFFLTLLNGDPLYVEGVFKLMGCPIDEPPLSHQIEDVKNTMASEDFDLIETCAKFDRLHQIITLKVLESSQSLTDLFSKIQASKLFLKHNMYPIGNELISPGGEIAKLVKAIDTKQLTEGLPTDFEFAQRLHDLGFQVPHTNVDGIRGLPLRRLLATVNETKIRSL